MIAIPRNVKDYESLKRSGRPIGIMFVKNDCTPCDAILPHTQALALLNPRLLFVLVNVDKPQFTNLQDVKDIKTYPTYKFFRDKTLTAKVIGANELKLNETVNKLIGSIRLP